jgi:outer membrane protein assembly factor BamB
MEDTGYAACTAVTDGKRVCAIFAGGDIGCFSIDGNLLWEKHLGIPDSMYGYAASLTAFENTIIIQWDVGYDEGDESQSKLIALDWQTGNSAWETHRPVVNSWSSPTVFKVGEMYQILTTSSPFVIAYDARTGGELYRVECLSGDIASTPIVADHKMFVIEPYNKLVAISTENASGDITETHIAWENDSEMPDICSPVTNGQFVWTLVTQGLLGCYDVKDGTEVYAQEIKGSFQASPTLVGEQMYLLAEDGTMLIVGTGPEYKEIKRSELGEKCYASPAFADGRIYIRAEDNLYAIGATE